MRMDSEASLEIDVKWAIVTRVEASALRRTDRTRLAVQKNRAQTALGQVTCIAGLVWVGWVLPVNAQSVAPASAASAPAKDAGPSERVQREASDVFRWIKLHADKPRKAAETKPASKSDITAASTDSSARAPAKGDKLAKAALATARVAPVTPSAPPVDLAVEKPTESTPLEVA